MKPLSHADLVASELRGDIAVLVSVTLKEVQGLSRETLLFLLEGRVQRAKIELLEQIEARGLGGWGDAEDR